jgi:demethylmenaquinone methyltransferase/2-methoxy-6-polyprenyl-1,4-benzoquinol methylase
MLADAVGPAGHVTGLDISPESLTCGEELTQAAGFAARISFEEGSVTELPFDDNTFDWAWSADCVGYIPLDPVPLIKELMRVVKPAGHIAILAWTSEKLLPGYPTLEARLNSTAAGIAPFVRGRNAETHFMRALGWLNEVGLKDAAANTFAGDVYAPLTEEIREALMELLQMRWRGAESELSRTDCSEFRRLCQTGSPDFILDQPDYYAFFTYSMFHCKVAK